MVAAAERVWRDPHRITLVVVTKGVMPDQIREVMDAGAFVLGENRVQEALPKISALGPGITWHLVGYLQRNKVKDAVGIFELIHSVDRLELARELDRRAAQKGIIQKVLVQTNVARESGKHGVAPEGLEALVGEVAALPHLLLEGLMVIPPLSADPEGSRPHFRWLAQRAEELRRGGLPLQELSMGMSNDFEVAIEEGATLIRVGTAIFGRGH